MLAFGCGVAFAFMAVCVSVRMWGLVWMLVCGMAFTVVCVGARFIAFVMVCVWVCAGSFMVSILMFPIVTMPMTVTSSGSSFVNVMSDSAAGKGPGTCTGAGAGASESESAGVSNGMVVAMPMIVAGSEWLYIRVTGPSSAAGEAVGSSAGASAFASNGAACFFVRVPAFVCLIVLDGALYAACTWACAGTWRWQLSCDEGGAVEREGGCGCAHAAKISVADGKNDGRADRGC